MISSMTKKLKKLSLTTISTIYLVAGFSLLVAVSGEVVFPIPIHHQKYQDWVYEPRTWHYAKDDLKVRETSKSSEESSDEDLSALGISRDEYHEDNETSSSDCKDQEQIQRSNINWSRFFSDDCDQAKLDTKYTVVCTEDKCDKLKFTWPEYNNQITIVQTTKHGLRFNQVHHAFSSLSSYKLDYLDSSIKFDLFDIFKPKTTQKPRKKPNLTTTKRPDNTSETDAPSTTPKPGINNDKLNDEKNQAEELITTIKVDLKRKYQTIQGFGGALSDSTCLNIKSLSAKMSKSIVEDYFGDDGLRYSFVRMSIGSSDFSTTPYTNNDQVYSRDNVTEDDDVDMMNFRLTKDDYEQKIPMARLVQSFARGRKVKFLASMWSPPVWMKNNSHIVHGFLKGDVYGPYYHALAELTLKFLDAYKKQGIDFWGLTVLNEPVTGIKPFIFHNSLGFTVDDYVTYIKVHLGPLLERRGFNHTKLLILDDNKGYAPKWVRAVFEDPDATKYVDGVAIHWYMNDEYENLNFIPQQYPDKFILSTEACSGHLPFQKHAQPGNWERGVSYMMDIVNMMHKSTVGWIDWNMALDLHGGPSWAQNNLDSPIIVNLNKSEYYRSPMYYAIGHFSRFVEPGSIRVSQYLTNYRYDYPIDSVSFLTPNGYVVIVCYNNNKHSIPINIVLGDILIRKLIILDESFNTIIFKKN